MSAIDTTFHWCRQPSAINGLQTTYVSKRGSDVSGDGTAQNPYASLAKATSVATANTNIMLDDGEWNELRTNNNRYFNIYGNTRTVLYNWQGSNVHADNFFYLFLNFEFTGVLTIENCIVKRFIERTTGSGNGNSTFKQCVFLRAGYGSGNGLFLDCVIISLTYLYNQNTNFFKNCIILDDTSNHQLSGRNNNFTKNQISLYPYSLNSINDTSTGQTIADYFNYIHSNVLANPTTATFGELLQCDFTAKEGSKNIGAGEKGTTIGLNQGYTMYADNSANDVFKESNGATLKNIAWDNTLNGYVLVQKERVCQGATATTIILDSEASSQDDYYNNLFIGIVAGDGYGEFFLITDYDGATKTATIDGTWTTTPNTNSIYTISGTILSAVKDFGKAIKVKRNWTFADNFTALTDGKWAEFMTHVETNGKQLPANCYSYEYSTDGTNFVQGQTADDLVSATNGENKVTDAIYGDCSPNYDEATAKNLVMRYIRVRVHIGFNIGQIGE